MTATILRVERLRDLWIAMGMNQEELGLKIGMTRQAVSLLETGKRRGCGHVEAPRSSAEFQKMCSTPRGGKRFVIRSWKAVPAAD